MWCIYTYVYMYTYIYIYMYIHTHYTYTHIHTHIHNRILLSHKKNERVSFVTTWVGLKIIILREVSHTEKHKYHMISLICRLQKMIKTTYLQNINRLMDLENKLTVIKRETLVEG